MAKSSMILISLVLLTVASTQIIDLNLVFSPETQAKLGKEYQDPEFLRTINNYFGCKTWVDGHCTQCSESYIFNNNRVCCKIDPQCKTFNRDVGVCEGCYPGYFVNANGTCSVQPLNGPEFRGCAEWKDNKCVKCSVKYYSNAQNVCVAVDDQCREWNTTSGICTSCYPGYRLQDGQCVIAPPTPAAPGVDIAASNPLCRNFVNGVCQECAQKAYFNTNRQCLAVDPQCNTYDRADGLCLSCFIGYELQDGKCVKASNSDVALTDAGCKTWEGNQCLQCSFRWIFNSLGACIPVEDSCKTFNDKGDCLSCYPGYTLSNEDCIYIPPAAPAPGDGKPVPDTGCKSWDWNALICLECSPYYVFNSNGVCIPVSTDCRTYNSNGDCTGCYRGYKVQDNKCVAIPAAELPPSQLGCRIWDWDNQVCLNCSNWWFFDVNRACQEVNPLCQTYNATSGICKSCYQGFSLQNGQCVPSQQSGQPTGLPADLGCKTWNGQVCTECSFRWVFNSQRQCIPVDDTCKTNDDSGNCLTCYFGYILQNGNCIYSQTQAKLLCKQQDPVTNQCRVCANRAVLASSGQCIPVSDLCRTYDEKTRWCTSCYRGYTLFNTTDTNGQVIAVNCAFAPEPQPSAASIEPGCKIFDWDAKVCIQCSQNWFFDNKGKCSQVSPLCRSHDINTGLCLTCYFGYILQTGSCGLNANNIDPGCHRFQNFACVQCSQNWAFDQNKVCKQVSDSCKTHQGFNCTSCYNGFVLVQNKCQLAPQNTLVPTDAGCKTWDWAAQKCLQCSFFWYSNNGVCVPVDPYCKTFNASNGDCLTCYKGYALNQETKDCGLAAPQAVTDAGCAEWNWDQQACQRCSPFWYRKNGACVVVDPYCKTYNQTSGACTNCYGGYSLSQGACSLSPATLCKTSNAEGCLTCYNGFVLYQKQCITLNSISNIALYYAECCPEKLEELRAEGRIPQ